MDENSVIKLLKYLSGLSSIDTTLSQNDTFIHLILQELSSIFHADYAYIGFYIQQSGSSRKLFSKSYGLPEEQCIYLNSLVTKKRIKTTSTKLQTHASVYQLGNVVSVDMGNQQKTETIGIKTIIQLPIFSNSNQNGSIALYYSKPSKLESQNLDYLYIIGEMISNLFLLKSNLQNLISEESERMDYFRNSYDAMFILNTNYEIIDTNKVASKLINPNFIKLSDYVEDVKDLVMIQKIVNDLTIGDNSQEVNIKWSLNIENADQPFHITMKFGFTRILMPNTEIRTIASGRLNLPKPGIYSPKSIINTMDQEILRNLKIYWELYQADPDEATLLANDVFFPAAFALVVNEESGPLPLVTSPKVDINDIMEEVIRLIAGLNANKIVEQYYITGSQPWSKPHGDFRWIAFFRNNIEARGNVELHVLGVVTATNLLLAKPTLNQAILGILLGTMNSYLTIIEDDGADFITKSYHHDKYFSTLSLISDSLNEMRNVCGEILAAYMSEEVI